MPFALSLAAAIAAQGSRPESRPASSVSQPATLRVGDLLTFQLDGVTRFERVVRLDVSDAEPLTLMAESFDADVSIAVADESGAEIARDDDSGTETNACLLWTPPRAGAYRLRVAAKDAAKGDVTLRAVRGSLDAEPEEPELAAIAYWDLARDRARQRSDASRESLALDRLSELEGADSRGAVAESRRERDEALARARARLAEARNALEANDRARARERVAQAWSAVDAIDPSEESAPIAMWLLELASVAESANDLQSARVALGRARGLFERTLPRDHTALQAVRHNLALQMRILGEVPEARAIEESVVEACGRTLPPDHALAQASLMNLAVTLRRLGHLERARSIEERVLEVYERTLPPDHLSVQKARGNLAITLEKLGKLQESRRLAEKVLDAFERTLSRDDPNLQKARTNLAQAMRELGDLAGARALEERALEAYERSFPPLYPDAVTVRQNLALTIKALGDLPGARALEEKVLEIREKTMKPDDFDLQAARLNLSETLRLLGDPQAARALQERVLEFAERTLSPDHFFRQTAREHLAASLMMLEDFEGARALEEGVLETWTRTLPWYHSNLQRTRINLARLLRQRGELPRARALQEQALDVFQRTLPPDHFEFIALRTNLAITLAESGDADATARALAPLGEMNRLVLRNAWALSPREAQEIAAVHHLGISACLSLAPLVPAASSLPRELFAWAETRRVVATPGRAALEIDDPKIRELRATASAARKTSSELVSAVERDASSSSREHADAIAVAARARDDAERALAAALAARGFGLTEITVEELSRALPEDAAAVGYLSYLSSTLDLARPGHEDNVRALLAHVVRRDGRLARVELGPIAPIQAAVERWRNAIDAPLAPRNVGGLASSRASVPPNEARDAGEALRKLVLDPVVEAAGVARRLHVCLDGALHLASLDALPEGKGVVGDERAIRIESSFARLLRPTPSRVRDPSMLCIGDVDFGADVASSITRAASFAAPPFAMDRSSKSDTRELSNRLPRLVYRSLPATGHEIDAIVAGYEARFGASARQLRGAAASKAAFLERAPDARFLHLATHGYYSDAAVKVWGEMASGNGTSDAPAPSHESLESRVKGLSPMALCGLVFAGANRGSDALGRVPGILTAEELAGVDLDGCELAVLSACETNVADLPRAGLGIQSLQAALHAAGVRTAITSLWSVPDERTRELMVDFYRRLWVEKRPVAAALWEAKKAARAKGWPLRDWAGWVLTGDPGDEPARAASGPASRPGR